MKLLLNSGLRFNRHIRVFIVTFFILALLFMFPKGESLESEVTIGSVWIQDDLIASTSFEILKPQKIFDREREAISKTTFPIFICDTSLSRIMVDSLSKYNSTLIKSIDSGINNTFLSNQSFDQLKELNNRKSRFSLLSLTKHSLATIRDVYSKGIIDANSTELKKDTIAIRNGKYEKLIPLKSSLIVNDVSNFISFQLMKSIGLDNATVEALDEYLIHFIKPNMIYSSGLTEIALQNAKAKIPRNIGIVNENERIVAKHDRVTPEIKTKIDSYRIAKAEGKGIISKLLQSLGKILHLCLIITPFIIYLLLFRKKIFNDNVLILLICCVVLFIASMTYLINNVNITEPIEYLVLVPVASMLLTIIFDSRVGFYGTIIVGLIVGALHGNDYSFAVTNIVTGGLAAYTVRDVKNRTQIFRSFLFIFLGYAFSIIAFGLERFEATSVMFSSLIFAFSNALVSPVLTYGLIIFVERIFKITTDLTLLELTDMNRPLLRELSKTASGTFSHSVAMGTLAETTAGAINANTVLAKVGAYYHDIGKIYKPDSFTENQINTHNIHENISPEESVELIREHVQKGIELAKKNKLPQEVIDFIPMHHGTMVISFFYEKAKNLYGEGNINIDEFRYLGPKPNSKETAIVMLADSCESAIRSLTDADSETIENVINNLINNRIEDGQLDDASLTFKDIKKIKESFLSILVGHQHRRIRYPNQNELESKSED